MISQHLRDRFFQRYARELTPEVLVKIVKLALASPPMEKKDPTGRDLDHVWVRLDGQEIRLVFHRSTRTVLTFLPGRVRLASCLPKRRRKDTYES